MIIKNKKAHEKLTPNQLLLCIKASTVIYITGLLYRVSDCGYYIFDSYGPNPALKGSWKDHSCCVSFGETEFILAPNLALLLYGELNEN